MALHYIRVTTEDILWATLAYNTNQLSTAIHWTAGGQVPATFAEPLRIYFTLLLNFLRSFMTFQIVLSMALI